MAMDIGNQYVLPPPIFSPQPLSSSSYLPAPPFLLLLLIFSVDLAPAISPFVYILVPFYPCFHEYLQTPVGSICQSHGSSFSLGTQSLMYPIFLMSWSTTLGTATLLSGLLGLVRESTGDLIP